MSNDLIASMGARSIEARQQLVRSGDKQRITTLREVMINIGACPITIEGAKKANYKIITHKFSFMLPPITFALIPESDFNAMKPLTHPLQFEVEYIKNGVIGLKIGDTNVKNN